MTSPTTPSSTPGAELRARADESGGEVGGVAVPAVVGASTPLAPDATALPDEAAQPTRPVTSAEAVTQALDVRSARDPEVAADIAVSTSTSTSKPIPAPTTAPSAPAAAVTPVTTPPAPAAPAPAAPVRDTVADLTATAEDDMGKKDGVELDSVAEARRAVEATRSELADTVEALAAKADVKGRATAKADEVRADVTAKATNNPVPFIAAGVAVLALVVLRLRSHRTKKKKR